MQSGTKSYCLEYIYYGEYESTKIICRSVTENNAESCRKDRKGVVLLLLLLLFSHLSNDRKPYKKSIVKNVHNHASARLVSDALHLVYIVRYRYSGEAIDD